MPSVALSACFGETFDGSGGLMLFGEAQEGSGEVLMVFETLYWLWEAERVWDERVL